MNNPGQEKIKKNTTDLEDAINYVNPERSYIADKYKNIYPQLNIAVEASDSTEKKRFEKHKTHLDELKDRLLEDILNSPTDSLMTLEKIDKQLDKISEDLDLSLLSESSEKKSSYERFYSYVGAHKDLVSDFELTYDELSHMDLGAAISKNFIDKAEEALLISNDFIEKYINFSKYATENFEYVDLPEDLQEFVLEAKEDISSIKRRADLARNALMIAEIEKSVILFIKGEKKITEDVLDEVQLSYETLSSITSLPKNARELVNGHLDFLFWHIAEIKRSRGEIVSMSGRDSLTLNEKLEGMTEDQLLSLLNGDTEKNIYSVLNNEEILRSAKDFEAVIEKHGLTDDEFEYSELTNEQKTKILDDIGYLLVNLFTNFYYGNKDIPKDPDFYGAVVDFLEKATDSAELPSEKAQGSVLLGQLYALIYDLGIDAPLDDDDDINYMPPGYLETTWLDRAEQYKDQALKYMVEFEVDDLSQNIKIHEDHIPAHSLLKYFIDNGYVELSKEGTFSVTEKGLEDDTLLPEIHTAVKKQVEIERMRLLEDELGKKSKEKTKNDPFFEASQKFLLSQRQLAENNIDQARVTLVEFLEDIDKIESEQDEEVKIAVQEAHRILRELSMLKLNRLKHVANSLFGKNKKHESFLNKILDSIDAEAQRLVTADDYVIKSKMLKRYHPFDAEAHKDPTRSYGKNLSLRARKPGLRSKKTENLKLGKQMDNTIKNNPKMSIVTLWNDIVDLETSIDYKTFTNPKERKRRYTVIANNLRRCEGSEFIRVSSVNGDKYVYEEPISYFPEVAGVYYREGLRDDMTDVEIRLHKEKKELQERLKADNKQYEKYKEQAKELIKDVLDSEETDSQILKLLGQHGIKKEHLKAMKEKMYEESLDILAQKLMESYVDTEIEKFIFSQFEEKGLPEDSEHIWDKLNDMEGIFGAFNFSDEVAREMAKELAINTALILLSMGIASVVVAGIEMTTMAALARLSRAGYATGAAARAAEMARTGHILYRGIKWGTKVTTFTVAEKILRQAILDQNTWGTFGRDLGFNMLMFGGIELGTFAWQKALGRYLVYEDVGLKPIFQTETLTRVQTNLYKNAGMWGKTGLWTADQAGRLATETLMFTTLGSGYQLATTPLTLDDMLNKKYAVQTVSNNVLTILALRGGNLLVSPVIGPFSGKMARSRDRILQDVNPDLFVKDFNLPKTFFDSARAEVIKPKDLDSNPASRRLYNARLREAEIGLMDKYRANIDKYRLSKKFFEKKTPEEIERILIEIDKIESRNRPLEGDELVNLVIEKPEIFEAIEPRLRSFKLNAEQVTRIAKVSPDFLLAFGEKIRISSKELAKLASEKDVNKTKQMILDELQNTGAPKEFVEGFLQTWETLKSKFPTKLKLFVLFMLKATSLFAADGNIKTGGAFRWVSEHVRWFINEIIAPFSLSETLASFQSFLLMILLLNIPVAIGLGKVFPGKTTGDFMLHVVIIKKLLEGRFERYRSAYSALDNRKFNLDKQIFEGAGGGDRSSMLLKNFLAEMAKGKPEKKNESGHVVEQAQDPILHLLPREIRAEYSYASIIDRYEGIMDGLNSVKHIPAGDILAYKKLIAGTFDKFFRAYEKVRKVPYNMRTGDHPAVQEFIRYAEIARQSLIFPVNRNHIDLMSDVGTLVSAASNLSKKSGMSFHDAAMNFLSNSKHESPYAALMELRQNRQLNQRNFISKFFTTRFSPKYVKYEGLKGKSDKLLEPKSFEEETANKWTARFFMILFLNQLLYIAGNMFYGSFQFESGDDDDDTSPSLAPVSLEARKSLKETKKKIVRKHGGYTPSDEKVPVIVPIKKSE